VEKGNTKVVEAVNTVVENLRADGTLAEILERNGLSASAAEVG
jgi:ABC-type amino acid transport substrate-binding protein